MGPLQGRKRSEQESISFVLIFPSGALLVCSSSSLDDQRNRPELLPPIEAAIHHQDTCFLCWECSWDRAFRCPSVSPSCSSLVLAAKGSILQWVPGCSHYVLFLKDFPLLRLAVLMKLFLLLRILLKSFFKKRECWILYFSVFICHLEFGIDRVRCFIN